MFAVCEIDVFVAPCLFSGGGGVWSAQCHAYGTAGIKRRTSRIAWLADEDQSQSDSSYFFLSAASILWANPLV